MIDPDSTRNTSWMQVSESGISALAQAEAVRAIDPSRQLEALAAKYYQFIWRSLRRLGVAEHAVDDATQHVFEIAAVKLLDITPGCERAFLFQTAMWTAMSLRRNHARRREAMLGAGLEALVDPSPLPDAAVEERRQRLYLDRLLDFLTIELRTVFVLFEIEGLSAPEIASLLNIPVGTVASRLRRAREVFRDHAARLRKQLEKESTR